MRTRIKIVLAKFNLFDSNYEDIAIESLFVRYLVLPKDAPKPVLKFEEKKIKNLYFQPIDQNNLPTDTNLTTWGNVILETPTLVQIKRGKYLITISIVQNIRSVSILLDDNLITTFVDTISSDNSFTREIRGQTLKYVNGKISTTVYKEDNTLFMQKLPKDTKPKLDVITLDLETRNLKDKGLEVISAVFFDGLNYFTYFLTDYKSPSAMINQMLKDLLNNPEYKGRNIYIHNLSNFDGVFLLS